MSTATVAATRSALSDLILNLSQSKQVLARETTAWTLRAPSLEAGITLAKIAQDELGHAQVLAGIHAEHFSTSRKRSPRVGLKGEITHPAVRPLAGRTESWPEQVALMCFWDTAVTALLEALSHIDEQFLRTPLAKICRDEGHHWLFAKGSARELLARDGQVPATMIEASKAVVLRVRRWLEAVDEVPGGFPLAGYATQIGPLLEEMNIAWPAAGEPKR